MQETVKATVTLGKLSEHIRFHPHHSPATCTRARSVETSTPNKIEYAYYPFHAHRSCFDTRAVIGGAKHRDHLAHWELDVPNGLVGLVDLISERQRSKANVGKNALPFLFVQDTAKR